MFEFERTNLTSLRNRIRGSVVEAELFIHHAIIPCHVQNSKLHILVLAQSGRTLYIFLPLVATKGIFLSAPPRPGIQPCLSTKSTGQTLLIESSPILNDLPIYTSFTFPTPSSRLLPLGRQYTPASPRSIPSFLSRRTSTKTVKTVPRSWQGQHNPNDYTPYLHSRNSSHKHAQQETSETPSARSSKNSKQTSVIKP